LWYAVAVDSGGVAWVNDSKATNVESTAAGLRGLSLPLPEQQRTRPSLRQTGAGAGEDEEGDRGGPGTQGEGMGFTEGGRAVVLLGGVAKVSCSPHALRHLLLLPIAPTKCCLSVEPESSPH